MFIYESQLKLIMNYKLVCFDVDGTLIDNLEYSWQVFHDYFRVNNERREKAKEDYYSGKISYLDWANHDINMWLELDKTRNDFISAIEGANLKLMEGASETLAELKKRGIKLAIISGSISIIIEHFIPNYKELFDDIYLSWIDFDNQGKIKRIKATAYDMEHKATALKKIAEKENFSLDECVFVGDHHNDVEISKVAGLSIAFNCKDERLRKTADIIIKKKDLREILQFID